MLLAALLACATQGAPAAACGSFDRPYMDESCECRTSVTVLVEVTRAYCRPDQDLRIEWEPAASEGRTEDEKRVAGVAVCECRGRP